MKIYALIAVVSACSLIISCTTDDLNNQNNNSISTYNNKLSNSYIPNIDNKYVKIDIRGETRS